MSFERIQKVKDRIIELRGQRKSGAEHRVWMDKARGLVHKIPSRFGQLWQKMHADYAERDLAVMRESGISVIPTEIYPEAEVEIAGKTRSRVSYLMEQQFYENADELSFADMAHYQKYRDVVYELACIGLEMRRCQGLGLDMMGGKAFTLIWPALNPMEDEMDPRISNLLKASSDVRATKDWPEFGIKQGEIVAREGEVQHCDTRLFDFDHGKGLRGRLLRCLLLRDQEVQDTAIWTLLESFGYKLKFNTEKNFLRRRIRDLFLHALPKMQAYAEASA